MVHLSQFPTGKPESAFYVHPESGFLIIYGQDNALFLNRQSTNNLSKVLDNQIIYTVLTSPTARILDVLGVFKYKGDRVETGDGAALLGVLTLPGRALQTFEFLSKRIFFMDRVTIENWSDQCALVELMGSQIERILFQSGLDCSVESTEVRFLSYQGNDVVVFGFEPSLSLGPRILVPRSNLDQLRNILREQGISELGTEKYEMFRVINGSPGPTGELNEDYTPLEVGLGDLVPGNKGCYTGQEILARQVTYDKVSQVLAGIRLEGGVNQGDLLLRDDRSIGTITSVAFSETHGWIALAVIRRTSLDYGSRVEVQTSELHSGQDRLIGGIISSLPFS